MSTTNIIAPAPPPPPKKPTEVVCEDDNWSADDAGQEVNKSQAGRESQSFQKWCKNGPIVEISLWPNFS